jgi:hypothetical protein
MAWVQGGKFFVLVDCPGKVADRDSCVLVDDYGAGVEYGVAYEV